MRETRTRTIVHHLQLAARHSGETIESILTHAVDVYESRTPAHARIVDFQPRGRDPYAANRTNVLRLKRMLGMAEPASHLHADLEEAIVLALPEPMQGECLRELAARYGLLAVADPGTDPAPLATIAECTADVMTQSADVLRSAGNLLDGEIDRTDLQTIESTLQEVSDATASLATLRAALADARDRLHTVVQLRAVGA